MPSRRHCWLGYWSRPFTSPDRPVSRKRQRYGRPQSYCPTEQGIRPYPIRTPVPNLRRPCPEQTPRSRYGPSRKQTERTPSRKDRLRPQDRRTPRPERIRRRGTLPPSYGRATETDSGAAAGNALPTPRPVRPPRNCGGTRMPIGSGPSPGSMAEHPAGRRPVPSMRATSALSPETA